ncbi:MAG: sugar transferase [Kofleriaceae bacterium]
MGILHRVSKRAFDLIGAGTALIASTPLVALAAAASRSEVGAPPFERLLRAGQGGEPFAMWRLRTHPASDLGAWLRGTGLASLPALWNVLTGEMSLVGPRPIHPVYASVAPARQAVKPGLTGWAQLHGAADATWDDEQALDRWYLEHRSLTVDAMIVARTLLDRVRRPGAAAAAAPGVTRSADARGADAVLN